MKLSQIKPNPSNPRVIKDDKFKKLVKSITDFPKMLELRPMIVNDDMILLGGNMRLKALQHIGYTEIPDEWVRKASDLTPEEQRQFIIKDNVGYGEWDWDMLANDFEIDELGEWGLDVPNIEDDYKEASQEVTDDVQDDLSLIETKIKKGDVIKIGKHRLMCGDSFSKEDVALLMDGELSQIVFIDPPYDLLEEGYCDNLKLFSKDAHVFVMHDDKGIVEYLRRSSLKFIRFYVANFGFSSPSGNDPYLNHILVSQETNGDAIKHHNMHDSFRSIIPIEYRFRLKDDKTAHKHQKPIEFVSMFINHFSKEDDIVLDLFGGSGTTMVSAETTNRYSRIMELDPVFCQLIINRMESLFPGIEIKYT